VTKVIKASEAIEVTEVTERRKAQDLMLQKRLTGTKLLKSICKELENQ